MEGATFRRKVKVHADAEVSGIYKDATFGDSTTANIHGGSEKSNYIFDVKVADSPTYGSAEIKDFFLNGYFDSINNATISHPSNLSIYKLKKSLTTSGEGGFTKGTSDIVIFTSRDESGEHWRQENFEGEFSERILNELRIGRGSETTYIETDPYILFEDAIEAAYGSSLSDKTMEDRYASTLSNGSTKVIKVKESKNWPGTWTPTQAKPWQNDPNWLGEGDERSWYHNFPRGSETSKNGMTGQKAGGNVKVHYSIRESVSDKSDNILADALHPENSIFHTVRNTNPVYDEDHTEGSPKYEAYAMTSRSKENVRTGSKAAKMQCLWRTGISATLGMGNYYGGKTPLTSESGLYKQPVGRQETRFTLEDVPAPVDFTGGDLLNARLNNDVAIEFDANFAKLERAYTYTQTTDSSDTGVNTDAYYASLRRAFLYTQGEVAPADDETLYDYLSLNYCYNWPVTVQEHSGTPAKTRLTVNTSGICGGLNSGDCQINSDDIVYFDFCNTSHLNENGVLETGNNGTGSGFNWGGGFKVVSSSDSQFTVEINSEGADPAVPSSDAGIGTVYKFSNKNFFGCAFINLDGTGMQDISGEGVRVVPFRGKDETFQDHTTACSWSDASTTVTVAVANTSIKVGQRPIMVSSAAWPTDTKIVAITESGGVGSGVTSFTVDNNSTRASSGSEAVSFHVHNIGHDLRTWYPNAHARDFVCRMDANDAAGNANSASHLHSNAVILDNSYYTLGFHYNPQAAWCLMDARKVTSEDNLDTWPTAFSPHTSGSDFMPNMRAATTGSGHGVTATTSGANGLDASSWPSNTTLWLTNVDFDNQTSMVGFGETAIASLGIENEDMEISATRDTRSEVFINQFRLRGFNWSHENATVCENNLLNRSNIAIKGGQTRMQFNDEIANKTLHSINNYNAWCLGFPSITDLQGAKRWLLFNGFFCSDLTNVSAYSDSNLDVMFTSEENFGKQVPPTEGGVSQLAVDSGSDGEAGGHEITSDGDYMCNNFKSKGWLEFDWDDATAHTANKDWKKRENIFASARVIGKAATRNATGEVFNIQISPSDETIFNLDINEKYIIYLYNEEWRDPNGDTHIQTATAVAINNIEVKSIDNGPNGTFIELSEDVRSIVTDANLAKGNILISPYRYWLSFFFDPGSSIGQSWETIGPTATVDPTTAAFSGTTYSEFLYNDTTTDSVESAYTNRWDLELEGDLSVIDSEVDYGFGAYDPELDTGGYINKFTPAVGMNDINVKGLLKADDSIQAGDTITLMIKQTDDRSESKSVIRTREYAGVESDPSLHTIFIDRLPEPIENFKVSPNEENPFFPELTWQVKDTDLWYGFISISDSNILNQYDGAILHYPLNEAGTHNTDISAPTENISGVTTVLETSGAGNTPSYHAEGLAGNAVYFDGGSDYIKSGTGNASDWSSITNEMSIVLHCIPDATQPSASGGAEIIQQTNWTKIQVNSSRQVEFYVYSAANRYVKCVSSSLIPSDDDTPFNIIATFDATLDTGNLKLFFNGILEDQSGVVVSAHGSDAEFTGWIQNTNRASNANYFQIGGGIAGRVEEVVVYNKCIYPVVPEDSKFIFTKPISELKTGVSIAESKSNVARLFVKDFHNIRGGLTNQVRASENISWRKAAFALDTT